MLWDLKFKAFLNCGQSNKTIRIADETYKGDILRIADTNIT